VPVSDRQDRPHDHVLPRSPTKLQKEQAAMVDVDRRTIFVAGLAATSFISNTTASAQQAAAVSPEARLRELGIELPKVTPPVANYVPSARLGNIIFLAGAGPLNPDGSRPQGKVGRDVTLERTSQ
jgi:enamine deaminase RidA (YjgF/YER057c/UK114 family)